MEIMNNWSEWKCQKQIHINVIKWSLTKEQRQQVRKWKFSINDVEYPGYQNAEQMTLNTHSTDSVKISSN